MKKYGLLFILLLSFSLEACKAGKKNCDCPSFPTKRPRRRSHNGQVVKPILFQEYPICGIVSHVA